MVNLELDVREHATAIKAAVGERTEPWLLYSYSEVPGDKNNPIEAERNKALPNLYAMLTVERKYLQANRRNAQASRTSWRATIRMVGRSVDEALWLDQKVTLALNEQRLVIGGRATTPLQHESSTSPEPDDGRCSGLVIYTYTH